MKHIFFLGLLLTIGHQHLFCADINTHEPITIERPTDHHISDKTKAIENHSFDSDDTNSDSPGLSPKSSSSDLSRSSSIVSSASFENNGIHIDVSPEKSSIKSDIKPKTYNDDILSQEDYEKVKEALQKLPSFNRPENIDIALTLIKNGEQVRTLIAQHAFHDAISLNLDDAKIKNNPFFNKAFNTTDNEFWNSIKNDSQFKAYAKKHDVSFTKESVMSSKYNMRFRDKYIRLNITDKITLKNYKQAYQESIVQLQWSLYARAALQDLAFTSGMITFHDPNGLIFKFLDGYSELINPGYKDHDGASFTAITQTKAYTRESSHWNGQKRFNNKNFGIDIRNKNGKEEDSLPGNKSHLLYGLRKNGMTFVKWEEYGVTVNPLKGDMSAITHTLRYFEKKDKEDDASLHRREKTPQQVINKFNELYPKKLTPEQVKEIGIHGISSMLDILDQYAPSAKADFENYLTGSMKYQADTLSHRKGSEVILHLPTQ